jgi:hypothetical protein
MKKPDERPVPQRGELGLGPPVQLAWVVDDVDRAAADFAHRFGAGPFVVARHIEVVDVVHRGVPGRFDHSSAYGQWGEVMVELVQQHGDAPSPVTEHAGAPHLHHVAHLVDDLDAALERCRGAGLDTAFTAATAGGLRFAFVDARRSLGHFLELYEPSDALVAFYAEVRALATGA